MEPALVVTVAPVVELALVDSEDLEQEVEREVTEAPVLEVEPDHPVVVAAPQAVEVEVQVVTEVVEPAVAKVAAVVLEAAEAVAPVVTEVAVVEELVE